jgi:hypothetical protein
MTSCSTNYMSTNSKSKADGNISKSMLVELDVHKNYLQVTPLDEKLCL